MKPKCDACGAPGHTQIEPDPKGIWLCATCLEDVGAAAFREMARRELLERQKANPN
jgi:ribosomal protein L37AE/L43A